MSPEPPPDQAEPAAAPEPSSLPNELAPSAGYPGAQPPPSAAYPGAQPPPPAAYAGAQPPPPAAYAGAPGPGYPGAQPPPPAAYAGAPGPGYRRPSPFAGIPAADYVRDGVAALLLLISLAQSWDRGADATSHVDVVLITLVSVLSLAAAYIIRAAATDVRRVLGAIRLVRVLANAPYFLLVFVYLIMDLVDTGLDFPGAGLGLGVALGLTGAVLAAQPRQSELAPAKSRIMTPWLAVVLGLGALLLLTWAVTLLTYLVNSGDSGAWQDTLRVLIGFAGALVLAAVPILGTALRDPAWRLVLLTLGGLAIVVYLIANREGGGTSQTLGTDVTGLAAVLWPTAAAAAAAPAVRRVMRDRPLLAIWHGAAARLLGVVGLAMLLQTAVWVIYFDYFSDSDRGPAVALIVIRVLYVGVAGLVAGLLVMPRGQAKAVLGYVAAGILLVLDLVGTAITARLTDDFIRPLDLLPAFAVPLALAVMVSVPRLKGVGAGPGGSGMTPVAPASLPVARYGPQYPPQYPPHYGPQFGASAQYGQPAPAWSPPPPPPPPTGPPQVRESIRVALDPSTPAATLAQLAASAPETWVYLAKHPAAYPDLLSWLGRLGDPAVDAALAEREG